MELVIHIIMDFYSSGRKGPLLNNPKDRKGGLYTEIVKFS